MLDTDLFFDQLQQPSRQSTRGRLVLRRAACAPPSEDLIHRSEGRYRLSCGKVGDSWVFRSSFPDAFVFSPNEHRIDCHLESTNDQAWHDVLLRRVLPRIATTYGALAVHAATVAIDDRCLLLIGASGAGKSTLTTFCATAGWDVLSDDTSLLWIDQDGVAVEPVQRGAGVWDAVRHALTLADADCTPMPGYDGRKWWYRPAGAPAVPRALSAVLLLERSQDLASPRLAPLSRQEALSTLLAQNIPFLPEAPSAAGAAAFGRIASLSRRVPAFRLCYRDGYDTLPHVEAWLRSVSLDGAGA